jgi:hypothetical protein
MSKSVYSSEMISLATTSLTLALSGLAIYCLLLSPANATIGFAALQFLALIGPMSTLTIFIMFFLNVQEPLASEVKTILLYSGLINILISLITWIVGIWLVWMIYQNYLPVVPD